MSHGRAAYLSGLRAHYEHVWRHEGAVVPFAGGPQHELPAGFSVLEFARSQTRSIWTYATCGMSISEDDVPMELHIRTLNRNREAVELLFATAYYHRTGSKLDVGHSVFFGKPWIDASKCEYGWVSLPYLDGPALENWTSATGNIVKCYGAEVRGAEFELRRPFAGKCGVRRPMEDTLFGAMAYNSRWVGRYSYRLFGKPVNVRLVVPCDEGDEIEAAQREAFSAFNSKRDELVAQAEAAIFTYYQNEVEGWREQFGAESADRLAPVINEPAALASLIEATDITIRRTYGSADRVVGLMFSCSWDIELGLAVKFLNEAVEELGPQDIVL